MKFLRSYFFAAGLFLAGLILLGGYLLAPGAPFVTTTIPGEIQVWKGVDGPLATVKGSIPANIVASLGVRMFPGDQVLGDGLPISIGKPIKNGAIHLLQYVPGKLITLQDNGRRIQFSSNAATLGGALWQASISLDPADRVQPAASTPLRNDMQVEIKRAKPVTITVGKLIYQGKSAADNVGEALEEMGLALQGLDYSQPPESEPVPASGSIRVVRVTEQVSLEQKTIPFKSQYQVDPETELDEKRVIDPGVTGLIVSRIRVRLEDGKEVSRIKEAEWTARQPKDQLVGYGTKAVVHTETVDGVTLEYWRKVTAYATSYAPCEIYPDHCSYNTASGMTLTKGVAAVIRSWYYQMRGQQVYVPGYGKAVIADIGAGVPGQNWIDLGYSDSDYVEWHQPVTVYFLTPIPANIPINLP